MAGAEGPGSAVPGDSSPAANDSWRRAADDRRRRRRNLVVAALVGVLVLVLGALALSRARPDGVQVVQAGTEDTTATSVPPPSDPSGTTGPGTSAPDGAAMVTVYAAAGSIMRGAGGEQVIADGLVRPMQIEARYAPSTAVVTPDALRQKVAVFDIAPDTVIVEGMFVDPPPTGTPSLPAPVRTPDGEQRMPWRIGADQSLPFADATTLSVSVTYASCGYPFEFAEQVVTETTEVIVVTVFAHEPSGQTLPRCSIDETTELVVPLASPVGDRRLYDGSQPVAIEVERPAG